MEKILDLISKEITDAFIACGYDAKYGKVTISNRPDLCEYQCNGSMAAAKEYKKAPFMIADEIVEKLKDNPVFEQIESVKPGFINIKLSNGSGFTEEQIAEIYERNTITTFGAQVIRMDDLFEVKNHFRLFDYMLDHYDDAITEEMLQEMHGILKRNTTQQDIPVYNVGGFKIKPKGIGFSDCSDTVAGEKVEPYLECLLEEYDKKNNKILEDLLDFHYAFEKIHPFSDANGRIGRMILFKECLKHQVLPFVILDQHKDFYIKGLKEYKTNKEDLIDICLNEQKTYKDVCERLRVIQ